MPQYIGNLIIRRIHAVNIGHTISTQLIFIRETDSGGLAVGLTASCKRRSYAGNVHIPKIMRAALEGHKPNQALDNLFRI